MSTALVFHPNKTRTNDQLVNSVNAVFGAAQHYASMSGQRVSILMQHDLKRDVFVLLAECGKWSFASYKKKPRDVCNDVATQIYKHVEKTYEPEQKKKRASGKKSR